MYRKSESRKRHERNNNLKRPAEKITITNELCDNIQTPVYEYNDITDMFTTVLVYPVLKKSNEKSPQTMRSDEYRILYVDYI
jgi:hypothetical protein